MDASEILNCYNAGKICGLSSFGGIVGETSDDSGSIKYCYNIGVIEEKKQNWSSSKGTIVGGEKRGIIQNCYYSNTSEIKAIKNEDDQENNVYGLTDDYMQSMQFVDLLNSGNEETVWKTGNDYYPYAMLTWQEHTESTEKELSSIEIISGPTKTEYIEGQNFDKAGMKVIAKYNDGTSREITNYIVTNGGILSLGRTSVTIIYTEKGITKEVEQPITVVAKELISIEVTDGPTKTEYVEGQNFDKAGMKVIAEYNNGTSKEITDYIVTNGENLKVGQTSVTIIYTEEGITKEASQAITVTAKETEELEIELKEESGYEIKQDDEEIYLENIKPGETIENVVNNIKTNGDVKVYKGTTEITDEDEKIATGMTIKITLNSETNEYKVVVTGDLNGDSQMNDIDVLMMARYKVKLYEGLNGEYLKASDIVKNGVFADDMDLLKMARILVGLDSI